MNRLSLPSLLIASAIAFCTFPGLASADTPTSPAGTTYTGKLHATSEGHVTIHNAIANIQCDSTLEGAVEAPGGGEPIAIPLTSLSFTGCTNDWHVTAVSLGTLSVHAISGSRNGTVTWSGATIEATRFSGLVKCFYKTEATDVGTLTGSKTTGATATIDLSGALPFHSGSSLCTQEGKGEPTSLTGSYSVATPDYLDVDDTLGPAPTSPAGTTYAGKLHATSEGHVTIDNPIANIRCNSTLEGAVEAPGGGEPIAVPLSSLSFTGCTNDWHVTAVSTGTLEIHAIAGSRNGTVTWSGATIETTRFGVNCLYKTEATDVGTLTGSKTTGATATIDLSGALPFHSGSSLCTQEGKGEPTSLTGSYSVATPDYLDVDDILGPAPTSPAGTTYAGKLHATSEGHVTIHNAIANIQCSSTLEGSVEAPGGGEPIAIPLTSLSFTGCTNDWHVTAVSTGTLEIHAIAGSRNGTVTWSGATIETTRFGVNCLYKTESTDIGTLTGSKTTGGTATIDLSGKLPLHSGSSGLCGSGSASFTGSYKVGTPDYLDVDD